MKPWVRNILLSLCALLVMAGAAYYWFIVESHVPGGAEFALDIGEVRRLAGAAPGDKPIAIEVEAVALFKPPAAFVVAGDGWKPTDLPVYSYRVVYPQSSVIIDTALNEELGSGNLASFDAAAFARMQAAMAQASLILLTHEHADHIGGLTTHPNLAAVLAATRLTREQIANPTAMLPARFPDHALDGYVPLDYRKYDAVAVQRERPRFVTQFTIKEDRAAVFGQLGALHRLHEAEPRIQIVPGHDGVAVERLIDARLMRPRFGSTASDQRN